METVSPNPVTARGLVVVGTSLGGLVALEHVLSALPPCFPYAVAVVQHRSKQSGDGLSRTLQQHCALAVREPSDKEPLAPGHVYLAPPDYHLLIDGDHVALSTEGPVAHARPSVDVLFDTAAFSFGARTVGVVLTGASGDGARGAARIKRHGGFVIVQSPETAESDVMPRAAMAAAPVDEVLPLEQIGPFLVTFCNGERSR